MANQETTFEKFALVVMLCSPTKLNKAWTSSSKEEYEKNVEEALAELHFSDSMKAHTMELMDVLFEDRAFFRGIADLLKAEEYDGNEPHPPEKMANTMIDVLRALDH